MPKINKHAKRAKEKLTVELLADIAYWLRVNESAKLAIYASISSGAHTLDERYIIEKLKVAEHVDKWLIYNIIEAKQRGADGELWMQSMQILDDMLNRSNDLFRSRSNKTT